MNFHFDMKHSRQYRLNTSTIRLITSRNTQVLPGMKAKTPVDIFESVH